MVITTEDILSTLAFYKKLGFAAKVHGDIYELYAGDCKLNVHLKGHERTPHARNIQIGSADVCFELTTSLQAYQQQLEEEGIQLECGPVPRVGSKGSMASIYVRDHDGNLLEFCSYE